jgi:hypothetical protein
MQLKVYARRISSTGGIGGELGNNSPPAGGGYI